MASFLGRFAYELDEDRSLRTAVGELLLQAVSIERIVDEVYDVKASKKSTLDAGWRTAQYCSRWTGTPTPADYLRWQMEQTDSSEIDENDPLVSYEYFAGLLRVRPGIFASEVAKRRVQYSGKDRHAADLEAEGDACNKAFFIKAGLTQAMFYVVCPHVITVGLSLPVPGGKRGGGAVDRVGVVSEAARREFLRFCVQAGQERDAARASDYARAWCPLHPRQVALHHAFVLPHVHAGRQLEVN